MAKSAHPQNKLIQLLSLAILVLGLGTSAFLVQQKINNSKAATGAPPPPVCPGGQFFCGTRSGCSFPGGCVYTSGKTCTEYLNSICSSTPFPSVAPVVGGATPVPNSCSGIVTGTKRCSGKYVQVCLSSGYWANVQLCSYSCSLGNCYSPATPSPSPKPTPKPTATATPNPPPDRCSPRGGYSCILYQSGNSNSNPYGYDLYAVAICGSKGGVYDWIVSNTNLVYCNLTCFRSEFKQYDWPSLNQQSIYTCVPK